MPQRTLDRIAARISRLPTLQQNHYGLSSSASARSKSESSDSLFVKVERRRLRHEVRDGIL